MADISLDTADGVEAEPSHFPLRAAEGNRRGTQGLWQKSQLGIPCTSNLVLGIFLRFSEVQIALVNLKSTPRRSV